MHAFPRYIAFAILGAFIVACVIALRGDLAQLSFAPLLKSWDLLALALLMSLGNYTLRIVRWQRYLSRLGHRLPMSFTALTYVAGFAFTLSPGKVGELVRARYYSRANIPMADVGGAFFVERLMDLMAMIVLGALIASALPRYHVAIWATCSIVLLVLIALQVSPWNAIGGWLRSHRIPRILARLSSGVANTLTAARALLRPGILLSSLCISLAAWGLEGLGLYVLGGMFPPSPLNVSAGTGIYAVAVLVGAISFLPGGLGSTEAVMTALLASQGYSVPNALVITLACRLVTLWLAVGIGWCAVFKLRERTLAAAPW